ncbi:hypothetical protein OAV88_00635 [bacterium]|nr:hypothetical protein [bacterium]
MWGDKHHIIVLDRISFELSVMFVLETGAITTLGFITLDSNFGFVFFFFFLKFDLKPPLNPIYIYNKLIILIDYYYHVGCIR